MGHLLSKPTMYASCALASLDCPGGEFRYVKDVARQTGIPPSYLAKIINTLRKRGFISARRGVNGGVRLASDAERISLFDICQAMMDPILDYDCVLCFGNCKGPVKCPGHEEWRAIRGDLVTLLQSMSVRQLHEYLKLTGKH